MGFSIWLHRHESSQVISLFELSLGITSGAILCQTFPMIFCSSKTLDKYLNLRFNDKVKVSSIMRLSKQIVYMKQVEHIAQNRQTKCDQEGLAYTKMKPVADRLK